MKKDYIEDNKQEMVIKFYIKLPIPEKSIKEFEREESLKIENKYKVF